MKFSLVLFFMVTNYLLAQETIAVSANDAPARTSDVLQGTLQKSISFGETLGLDFISDPVFETTSWIITNEAQTSVADGKGKSIGDYRFDVPGNYTIEFTLHHALFVKKTEGLSCYHPSIPKKIEVFVVPHKIDFLLDDMRFKYPLVGGVEQTGNIVYVPAVVKTYDGKPYWFKKNILRTSGVNATVTGHLADSKAKLSPGTHVLEYQLQGTVMRESYIMVDLTDATGNLQSIAIKEMIQ